MSISTPTRGLALITTLALSLAVLAAALLGPSPTLAQTHGPTCSASHAKTKCANHACSRPSRKSKASHAAKCPAKHAKTTPKTKASIQVAAHCEDGSTPLRAGGGSFSCDDDSEPECANGATPTRSSKGKSLVCQLDAEEEASSREQECEAGLSASCAPGTGSGAATKSAQFCENPANEESPLCEDEGAG